MTLLNILYKYQLYLRQRAAAIKCIVTKKNSRDGQFRSTECKNILFVLAGLLGDTVMSQPVIAAAREIWPESRITILCKSHNRDLLKADPDIDEFYVCDADPFSLRSRAPIRELMQWLCGRRFELSVILLGDQYAHLLAKAGIPARVGVKGTLLEPCLTHSYDIGSPRQWGASERLNALRVLGHDVRNRLPKLYVDTDARKSAAEKLKSLGLGTEEKFIAFHPFGSTQRQWWPSQNFAEFASKAKSRYGAKIVLLGGKETRQVTLDNEQFIDTRGKLSIPELLAVIDRADCIFTTDSGPFHIAGGLGKKVIGLFRNRRPEHANAYPTATAIFGQNDKCESECEWDICKANPCRQMAAIKTAQLITINDPHP
jgi:ADP-heptose:LPS heptosyltransferase